MRMKTLCIMLFLVLCLGTLAFGSGEKTGGPFAVTPYAVHEFEPVLDGDEITHNFVIQNKGDAELRIERIQTG